MPRPSVSPHRPAPGQATHQLIVLHGQSSQERPVKAGHNPKAMAESITDQEVKLWKTTLFARRFPGLRDLSDEEIRVIISADRKATGRPLVDPRLNRTYPKTHYVCKQLQVQPPALQPPFSPINPMAAKQTIRRPHEYISVPYDCDKVDYLASKTSDENKRLAPFLPSCASKAKDTLQVDYFLYSPTVEMKAADRETTRARATANMKALQELQLERRGKRLV